MAHLKHRAPELLFTEDRETVFWQFDKISKADWCDLYFDLYRQCMGETESGENVMADVKERLDILKANRGRAA